MTRKQCKKMIPIITAFADGEHIEFWDASEIVSTFLRGKWKTSSDIGFGRSCEHYRMIKDGMIYYFDGRSPEIDTNDKIMF